MDTIALHEAGFINTVAVSGTALTEKHIQIIKRLTHKIYLCFDNDKAWEAATRNALETLKNKNLEVKIILLKWGKDPDEIIKKWKDFKEFIDNAVSPISFYTKKSKVNLESIDEKKKFLSEILDVVRNYSDEVEKDSYLKEIATLLNIPVRIVYEELRKSRWKKLSPQSGQKSQNLSEEEIAIWYIFSDNSFWEYFRENIIFPEVLSSEFKKCLENIQDFRENLGLEQKEKYKALSLKLEQQWEITEDILKNFVKKFNTFLYRKTSSLLKTEMNNWNNDAFEKYSNFIKKAKKYGIK